MAEGHVVATKRSNVRGAKEPWWRRSVTDTKGRAGMTKPIISLQDLRKRIYLQAKAEPQHRFWGLYVHVCKIETLREAYRLARAARDVSGSPRYETAWFKERSS